VSSASSARSISRAAAAATPWEHPERPTATSATSCRADGFEDFVGNGHLRFEGNADAWKPAVEKFLHELGFGR